MKLSYIKLIIIEVTLIMMLLFNIFVTKFTSLYLISLLLVISIAIIKLTLGFEKNRNRYTKDAVMSILIYTLLYYLFIYIAGIFTGFLLSPYSLSIGSIISNIAPLILITFITEVFRYSLNKKAEKSKLILVLSVILFVIIDINRVLYIYDFSILSDVVKFTTTSLFPFVTLNIMLTYSSLKFGYLPNIVYRLIMSVPMFLIPIIPDFGEYIKAIIDFIFPAIVLAVLVYSYKNKKTKEKTVDRNKFYKIINLFFIICILVIVYLTSGLFKYYILSIGSGSMHPEIDKGDIVIVEKVEDIHELSSGEILVFEHDNIVVVHRIVEINEKGDLTYIVTKGDNNETDDNWFIYEEDIIGKVNFKIKYLGLPTVWLSEALK